MNGKETPLASGNISIGFAVTGSFCTLSQVLPEIERLVLLGAKVTPIMSEAVNSTDTRFIKAEDMKKQLRDITGMPVINTIAAAEPIGPKKLFDVLVIAPVTGNTLAKLANAITDSTVTMAAKAHLRNNRPLILGISTNDALGINAKNIGMLMGMKNIFFVPFHQDDPVNKEKSLVCRFELITDTIREALQDKQLQPILA